MITSTRLRLDHSHSFTQWPALRVTAFNLSPYPSLYNIPPLHSPLTIPCVHFLAVFNPSVHMLCWHIACYVCQLVNARCTAADKDQKDITNNRLLTGERDTQVPLRKSPLFPTIPSPAVCPTTIISGSLHSKALALLLPRSLFLIGWCLDNISQSPVVLAELKSVKLQWHEPCFKLQILFSVIFRYLDAVTRLAPYRVGDAQLARHDSNRFWWTRLKLFLFFDMTIFLSWHKLQAGFSPYTTASFTGLTFIKFNNGMNIFIKY